MKNTLRLVWCLFVALSLLFVSMRPAFACSGGGGDPVAMSEVIVGGWITDWQPANSGPTDRVEPVTLQISVDRVFKGNINNQTSLHFVNYQMLDYDQPVVKWDGGLEGSCSAFGSDPKGKYAIIGLVKNSDGQYQTDLWYLFYFEDQPPSAETYSSSYRLMLLIPFLPVAGAERILPILPLLISGCSLLLAGIWLRRHSKASDAHRP